jgi:ribosomal protein S18 acetylase RimI-like enzyme
LSRLTTRPSNKSDGQVIGEISFRSHTISFAPFTPAGFVDEQDHAEQTAWWRQFLTPTNRGHRMFVVEADGRVIGFSMVGPLNDRYEFYEQVRALGEDGKLAVLYSIHIDPDHLGGGAGQKLMETSLAHLKKAGFPMVVLDTVEANDRARRFYEAGGWEFVRAEGSDGYGSVAIYKLKLD